MSKDDAKKQRDELKAKAADLKLSYPSNISTAKLLELVAAHIEAQTTLPETPPAFIEAVPPPNTSGGMSNPVTITYTGVPSPETVKAIADAANATPEPPATDVKSKTNNQGFTVVWCPTCDHAYPASQYLQCPNENPRCITPNPLAELYIDPTQQ